MLKIGNIKLKNPLVLAPLADTTTISFRLMCKEYGAALVVTEMVNANALARNNKSTIKLARVVDDERPISIQIFGQKTEHLVKAAQLLEKDADIIDLNCGCPMDNVMNIGAGCSLLKRPAKLGKIIEELSSTLKIPVTVKMRTGLTRRSAEPVKIAKIIERSGAAAIALHARTQDQMYSGKADWNQIRQVKQAVSIPVMGNGDIISAQTCKQMLDETKCDFAMIGRAVMGNPYLFKQCATYLETGELLREQTAEERIADFEKLLGYYKKYEDNTIEQIRGRAMDFTKGFSGSARLRANLSMAKTVEEMLGFLKTMR